MDAGRNLTAKVSKEDELAYFVLCLYTYGVVDQ